MIWTVSSLIPRGCIWSAGEKRRSPGALKNVDEISKACIGRTLQGTKEVFEAAKAEQGIDVSFEELHEDCSRRFKEKEEREGLPEKPGVHEILKYLKKQGIPVALALPREKRQ